MSINWVMLGDDGFVRLPGEKSLYRSPIRTALSLTTPKAYPAHSGSVSISSDSGILYLTNQRVVYIPSKQSNDFKSFSVPLLNLHDTHIAVPWFGPNAWQAIVEPVPGGNLPATSTGIELKLTFKEGGATDFHSAFERIKERLQQAVESAQDGTSVPRRQRGVLSDVNLDAVHLDQLPSYEASGQDRMAPTASSVPAQSFASTETASHDVSETQPAAREQPVDAPPGYEETQHQSIQQELDRRLSAV